MPSWNPVEVKTERTREKVGLEGTPVNEGVRGPTTTRAGSSSVGGAASMGAQAARARREATARMEKVVAPEPRVSRAMLAPSSIWKIR